MNEVSTLTEFPAKHCYQIYSEKQREWYVIQLQNKRFSWAFFHESKTHSATSVLGFGSFQWIKNVHHKQCSLIPDYIGSVYGMVTWRWTKKWKVFLDFLNKFWLETITLSILVHMDPAKMTKKKCCVMHARPVFDNVTL